MSKIKILSENLANQIAAGEVVERPASVVKELLENALDAGASHVAVEVEGGGIRLIRIIDDGEGMDQDDVLLSLERHATSKLANAEQLAVISTLGFRGEAIPSISSVAKLTITSRPLASPLGTRAEIRYGQLQKVHEMGCAPGTVMEVKDLFSNVPARRKFLKSGTTEIAHITEIVKNYALVRHGLGVAYRVDGRVIFEVAAGTDSLEDRVRSLAAPAGCRHLIPLALGVGDDNGRLAEITIAGFLVPPDEGAFSTTRLRIFVNGRAVRDRMIAHAVAEGMHGYLMKGRGASGVIFINLAPQDVDVNVHPTKQEVRFARPQAIHDRVVMMVRQAMRTYQQTVRQDLFGPVRSEVVDAVRPPEKTAGSVSSWQQPYFPPAGVRIEEAAVGYGRQPGSIGSAATKVSPPSGSPAPAESVVRAAFPDPGVAESSSVRGREGGKIPEPRPVAADASTENLGPLRVIGQLMDSYILCETGEDFVIIDQHAAHERLLFEKLKDQYATHTLASQALLFPQVVECGPAEIQVLERYRDEIARMGLELAEFGGSSYVIKGVPAVMGHLPPEEILAGVIARFSDEQAPGASPAARIDNILASIACKAAVKANHRLDSAAMAALLESMREAHAFSHCPHGRPVIKHISRAEIAKWFRRT